MCKGNIPQNDAELHTRYLKSIISCQQRKITACLKTKSHFVDFQNRLHIHNHASINNITTIHADLLFHYKLQTISNSIRDPVLLGSEVKALKILQFLFPNLTLGHAYRGSAIDVQLHRL